MNRTSRNLLSLFTAVAMGVTAPVQAETRPDFDTYAAPVKNLTQGGTVKVQVQSKIEALENGDILSQATFFYPASFETLRDLLSTPEGVCSLSPFCSSTDGKGINVNLEDLTSGKMAKLWSPEAIQRMKSAEEKVYGVAFSLDSQEVGNATAISFSLDGGKIFTKLDATVTLYRSGDASTLVVVESTTHSGLAENVADRMEIAKRVMRAGPTMIDHGLND